MPDLLELLARRPVVCAEGYLFECERRGYLQAGAFVPEVVLEHPEVVEGLHREFAHAGSDVVEAFTYYGHREKLRVLGKEDILEPLNRQALSIAARVARDTGTLLAGNLSNTNVYEPGAEGPVRTAFTEQVSWAAEAGVDFIIAETFSWTGEALLALEIIREAGLPAVITFAIHREGTMRDGLSPADACLRAEQAGADVVGLNCIRGPQTMLPLLAPIREAVSCPVAALPVPYRTTAAQPSMQALRDPARGGAQAFPTALDPFTCTRQETGRVRHGGPGPGRDLPRGLLRGRPAPHPGGGRGGRRGARRVPLRSGHVEAFVPRVGPRHHPELPGVCPEPLAPPGTAPSGRR